MNGNQAIIILFSFLILYLVLFAPYTSDPVLFSPKQVPGTEQNLNPDSLEKVSSEYSDTTLSMMQDFLDMSGNIIVNIRYKDIDEAKEDIDEYRRLLQQYKHLVIHLDMTESEIDEFRKNSGDEVEILEKLAEDVENLGEMKKLQIQYQDSDDPDKYYSITYDLGELKKEIDVKKKELAEVINKKVEFGEKFELNTENQKKSTEEIECIGDENSFSEDTTLVSPTPTIQTTFTPTPTPTPTPVLISPTAASEIAITPSTAGNTESTTPISTADRKKNNENEDLFFQIVILVVIGILLISGRIKYISKKRRKESKKIQPPQIIPPQITKEVEKEPANPDLPDEYSKLLSKGLENDACRYLSKRLFQAIAICKNVKYRPSMTNNEFISLFQTDDELEKFSGLYEKIVYSGRSSENDKSELYRSYQRLMNTYGGN